MVLLFVASLPPTYWFRCSYFRPYLRLAIQ
jgi:hypothetical protein